MLLSVEKWALLQIHGLLTPMFLQLTVLPCSYLYHLLVELAQHMLPHGLLHEDTQICVGEPATPHALFFSHTAREKEKGMVDMIWTFPTKAASAQAGLEKTLLKLCRRELQSLAKAHRCPNLLFHCSRAISKQRQSQAATYTKELPTP